MDIVFLQPGLEESSFMWLKVHVDSLFTCHVAGWGGFLQTGLKENYFLNLFMTLLIQKKKKKSTFHTLFESLNQNLKS